MHVQSLLMLSSPLSLGSVPNDEGGKLFTADSWIDEGWEHVTSAFSKRCGQLSSYIHAKLDH